jgi:uncharacterized membrane protein YgdD (TMEM256/DUF423 family)
VKRFAKADSHIPMKKQVGDVSNPFKITSNQIKMSISLFRIAAALCFLAVALGAFGAHSLKQILETHGMLDVWNKAVFYHFIHALALLVLALFGAANRSAWWLLFGGIFIFSGSLYVMALTNIRWLGAITPIGGLCFLAGWAWLVIAPRS